MFHLNAERLRVRERPEAFRERDRALRAAVRSFREEVNQQRSQPGLDELQQRIVASVLKHWKERTVFVNVPEAPMDNSEAERQLRQVALGRKNYYGSGSVWSGYMTAGVLSVLQSARRNGLNPWKLSEKVREAIRARPGGRRCPAASRR